MQRTRPVILLLLVPMHLPRREALVALQDAAVLFFDPGLPAGANAGRPAAMHWELQHIAAGLGLDEAAVEAAAAQAAAFGGQWEAGSGGESPTGSDCVANGTCGEGAAGCKARSSSSSPDSMVDEAAQFDDPDTATSKALPLPPALAAKWLQSALPPSSTSLQLLRPAAATVLRAMLVSCFLCMYSFCAALLCRLLGLHIVPHAAWLDNTYERCQLGLLPTICRRHPVDS